jgi:hypothetical protein
VEIEALLEAGWSDTRVAQEFHLVAMSLGRHRRFHVVKPTQDRIAVLAKDGAEQRQRKELAQAAASDTPSIREIVEAAFGLLAQATKITRVEEHLDKGAEIAAAAGSPAGVAAIAGQQLRAIEVGSRLAGLPGFTPVPQVINQAGDREKFSVNIIFQGAGHTETITVAADCNDARQTIDVDPVTGDANTDSDADADSDSG